MPKKRKSSKLKIKRRRNKSKNLKGGSSFNLSREEGELFDSIMEEIDELQRQSQRQSQLQSHSQPLFQSERPLRSFSDIAKKRTQAELNGRVVGMEKLPSGFAQGGFRSVSENRLSRNEQPHSVWTNRGFVQSNGNVPDYDFQQSTHSVWTPSGFIQSVGSGGGGSATGGGKAMEQDLKIAENLRAPVKSVKSNRPRFSNCDCALGAAYSLGRLTAEEFQNLATKYTNGISIEELIKKLGYGKITNYIEDFSPYTTIRQKLLENPNHVYALLFYRKGNRIGHVVLGGSYNGNIYILETQTEPGQPSEIITFDKYLEKEIHLSHITIIQYESTLEDKLSSLKL